MSRITGKLFYGWWIVLASSLICMIGFGAGLYSFGVFFKPMLNEFGWSRAMTAGAFSMRRIEGGIASPIVGWAVDKYGPRPVIFIGGFILGAGLILMYFVQSILSLYIIYGLLVSMGMSTCLYLPNMTAISHWFIRKVSRAMSLLTVGAGVGGFLCAPAAAFLITRVGWRWSFVVMGLSIWIVILPLSLIIRRRPQDMGLRPDGDQAVESDAGQSGEHADRNAMDKAPPRDWTFREAVTSRVFWILIASFFLSGMTHPIITVHAIPALTDIGVPYQQAAFAFGFMVLISIAGRLSFGSMGDFFDKRYLIMATYILQALGILILMNAHSLSLVYCFTIVYGVGFGGGVPVRPALRAEYFGRESYGKIGGFMSPIIMVGSFSGPILAGLVFDLTGSYHVVFTILIVLQILAAGVMYFAHPPKQNPDT